MILHNRPLKAQRALKMRSVKEPMIQGSELPDYVAAPGTPEYYKARKENRLATYDPNTDTYAAAYSLPAVTVAAPDRRVSTAINGGHKVKPILSDKERTYNILDPYNDEEKSSPYRPSIGDSSNDSYYTSDAAYYALYDAMMRNYTKDIDDRELLDRTADYYYYSAPLDMGITKVGLGHDDRGKYLSIYNHNSFGPSLYDRVYIPNVSNMSEDELKEFKKMQEGVKSGYLNYYRNGASLADITAAPNYVSEINGNKKFVRNWFNSKAAKDRYMNNIYGTKPDNRGLWSSLHSVYDMLKGKHDSELGANAYYENMQRSINNRLNTLQIATNKDLPKNFYSNYYGAYYPGVHIVHLPYEDDDTDTHEITHAADISSDKYVRAFINNLTEKDSTNIQNHKAGDDQYLDYITDPDEIYSRVMALRRQLGVTPSDTVVPKMLDTYLKTYKTPDKREPLLDYLDRSTILELLNKLSIDNTPKYGSKYGSKYNLRTISKNVM